MTEVKRSDPRELKPITTSVFEQIKTMLDPTRDFWIKNLLVETRSPLRLKYSFINLTNDRDGEDEFLIVHIKYNEKFEVEIRWRDKEDEFIVCPIEEIGDVFKKLKISAS